MMLSKYFLLRRSYDVLRVQKWGQATLYGSITILQVFVEFFYVDYERTHLPYNTSLTSNSLISFVTLRLNTKEQKNKYILITNNLNTILRLHYNLKLH